MSQISRSRFSSFPLFLPPRRPHRRRRRRRRLSFLFHCLMLSSSLFSLQGLRPPATERLHHVTHRSTMIVRKVSLSLAVILIAGVSQSSQLNQRAGTMHSFALSARCSTRYYFYCGVIDARFGHESPSVMDCRSRAKTRGLFCLARSLARSQAAANLDNDVDFHCQYPTDGYNNRWVRTLYALLEQLK